MIIRFLVVALLLVVPRAVAQAPDPDAVLAEVVSIIEERHANARLLVPDGAALRELAATARQRMGPAPGPGAIRDEVHWLICRLGDGHAGVENWRGTLTGVASPLLLGHLGPEPGSPVIAFRQERTLVDEAHPFVTSIDGVPIEEWIATAAEYVVAGSPQIVRRRAVRLLRYVGWLREKRGAPSSRRIIYGLRSAGGSSEVALVLPVTENRAQYGRWPRSQEELRVLDGDIGYLRIGAMSRGDRWRAQHAAEWRMLRAASRGLIIDVRGNGGGVRELVGEIVPYLLTEKTGPIVATIARLRPYKGGADDGDGDRASSFRRLFPEGWNGWAPGERRAIERVRDTVTLQPTGAPEGFHGRVRYMVVSPVAGEEAFRGPVIVLIDDGVFSAADIFVGALDQVPTVTLMGQATGGGSARSRDHLVKGAGFSIRLASMASHHPEGRLYDTNGIEPDIAVEMAIEDYLAGDDRMLGRAMEMMRTRID